MEFGILITNADSGDMYIKEVHLDKTFYDKIDDGVPLAKQIAEIEVSTKNEKGNRNDFVFYRSYFPIVSDKVKKTLQSLDGDRKHLEFIKIKFFKDKIKTPYWFMNVLDNIDAIDREHSDFTVHPEYMGTKAGKIRTMKKPVLDRNKIGNRNIFRLVELEVNVVVSGKLIDILHEHELTGFESWPLDRLT